MPLPCETIEVGSRITALAGLCRGALATPLELGDHRLGLRRILIETPRRCVAPQIWADVPERDDEGGVKGAGSNLVGKGGDAARFHVAVEGFVVGAEALVVRQAPGLAPVVVGHHQAGNVRAADAAGRLNVLRGGERLSVDDHQRETRDIQTDGHHVRRQHRVEAGLVPLAIRQLLKRLGVLPGGSPAGELLDSGIP